MTTFKKSERLAGFRLSRLLFTKGAHLFHYPFRIHYLCMGREEGRQLFAGQRSRPDKPGFPYPVKCLVGVSARQVRQAVLRNRIRRLVKEAYRKNKSLLYTFLDREGLVCLLALVYVGKREMSLKEIEEHLQQVLNKLKEVISQGFVSGQGDGGSKDSG